METRGRKPKPAAIKKLEGNPGKRKIVDDLKVDHDFPEKPDWLNKHASKEWDRISPAIKALDLISVLDMGVFASYCQAYGNMVEAEHMIKKYGKVVEDNYGYQKESPWVKIARNERRDMRSFASEFGLTPAARCKIDIFNSKNEKDDMEDLLGGE